jgi:hypothetical protein
VAHLVDLFKTLGIAQDDADTAGDQKKFNRLYWELKAVEEELKKRPGDARKDLLSFYADPNLHVRLVAAKATLAIAPEEAREALIKLRSTKGPQALDAGMTIRAIDEGIYKPV